MVNTRLLIPASPKTFESVLYQAFGKLFFRSCTIRPTDIFRSTKLMTSNQLTFFKQAHGSFSINNICAIINFISAQHRPNAF
jgi:hypothetical protein